MDKVVYFVLNLIVVDRVVYFVGQVAFVDIAVDIVGDLAVDMVVGMTVVLFVGDIVANMLGDNSVGIDADNMLAVDRLADTLVHNTDVDTIGTDSLDSLVFAAVDILVELAAGIVPVDIVRHTVDYIAGIDLDMLLWLKMMVLVELCG